MAAAVPFIITAVISTAVSIGISKMMAKSGKTDQEDIGAHITKAGSQSPRNRVFGRCRASCTSVYSNVLDHNQEKRLDVFSIAGIGRLKYIHQAWIDEKTVLDSAQQISTDPTKAGQGLFTGNALAPKFRTQGVQIQFRNGSDIERAMELAILNSDGEWTEAMRGDRVPQVAVTANRVIDKDGVVIVGNSYNISCEVTGGDCFDPRTGGKSPSNNPVLALYEVLTDKYYGMAIDADYIDTTSFMDAANWTDANKLHINGEINCNQSYNDILINILSCFSGSLIIEGGRVKVLYEDVAPVYDHLDEDSYIRGTFDIIEASSSDYHNAVNISYKSFQNEEAEDQFQLPSNIMTDATIRDDGVLRTNEIKMPLTIDGYQANADGTPIIDGAVAFIANREYRRAKFKRQCTMDIDLLDFPKLTLYSVMEVSNKAHGWDRKKFRVSNIRTSVDDERMSIASITLDEYNEYIYTGKETGKGSSIQPRPPAVIKRPTGLSFHQATYTNSGYGELRWKGEHFSQSLEYQVDYKLAGIGNWVRAGETNATIFKFANLKKAKYYFRVRVLDRLLGTSDWSEVINFTVTSAVTLPAVTGVMIDMDGADFKISWDDMTRKHVHLLGRDETEDQADPDSGGDDGRVSSRFAYYQINIRHGDKNAPLTRTYKTTNPAFNYTLALNRANVLSREITAEVFIVTTENDISPAADDRSHAATAKNPQHAEPKNLTCFGKIGAIWTEFAPEFESDFAGTEIHISETQGFTPNKDTLAANLASETLHIWYFPEGSKDTDKRYVRVGHYDVFNKAGIKFSAEQTAPYHSIQADVEPFDPTELEKDLEKLEGDLAANTKRIDDNKKLIDQNKSDITQLDKDLADHKDSIDVNNEELKKVKKKLDENVPNVYHELSALRDWNNAPKDANGYPIPTRINLVASQNGNRTAGWGLFAEGSKDGNTHKSRFIVAADELIIGGGNGTKPSNDKRAFYYNTTTAELLIDNATIRNLAAVNIASDAITTNKIAADAVTATKVAANAIAAKNIQAGAITTAKINAGAVQAGQVGANAIYAENIRSDAVISRTIKSDQIEAKHIKTNAITSNKINAGAVTTAKLEAQAVTAEKIRTGTITADQIKGSTITGNKISSATMITAGSGNSEAGMNGKDNHSGKDSYGDLHRYNDYRFWSGGYFPGTAPFSVDKNGHLKATSADLEGAIRCGEYKIDGKTEHKFTVDWNGKLVAEDADIRGKITATSGSFPASLIAGKITADQIDAKDFVTAGQTIVPKSVVAITNKNLTNSWVEIARTSVKLPTRDANTRIFSQFSFNLSTVSSTGSNTLGVRIKVDGVIIKTINFKSTHILTSRYACGDSGSCTSSYYAYPQVYTGSFIGRPTKDISVVTLEAYKSDKETQKVRQVQDGVLIAEGGQFVG